MSDTISGERLLNLAAVKAKTGLGHTFIYEQMARGAFPVSRRVGASRTAWLASEIDEWIAGLPRWKEAAPGRSAAASGRGAQ